MQIRSMVIYPQISGQLVFGRSDRRGENKYKKQPALKEPARFLSQLAIAELALS